MLTAPLLSDPSPADGGSLSSANASYDGNALILTGHVVLDHGLGKMTAEEASLEKQETGKDFPFSHILLKKEVLLYLKNNAKISCSHADLDFTSLKGKLSSSSESRVVYSDAIMRRRGGEKLPLNLHGNTVELNFLKQAHDGKKTEFEIETILAKGDVLIEYAGQFKLNADHALYRRVLGNDIKKEFQGMITAYPKDNQSQCRLSHDLDVVNADVIDLDLIHSKFSLLHANGTIASGFIPHSESQEIRFRAEHLVWDHLKNALLLKGDIQIQEASLGTLTAQDEMEIDHSFIKGKHLIQSIRAKGPTLLLTANDSKIFSQGTIVIDRDKLLAVMESPEEEGSIALDKQIYYEEKEIGIFADSASLEYSVAGNTLQPLSLALKGNVRLFSHDTTQPLRCGLADRLNYSLTTHTLILAAHPGRKVLFWDEAQGMRLSAHEVHITVDSTTGKQSVKGVGHVQFAFTAEEQSKLHQLFPQLKPAQ
jgi:hypothetical protein